MEAPDDGVHEGVLWRTVGCVSCGCVSVGCIPLLSSYPCPHLHPALLMIHPQLALDWLDEDWMGKDTPIIVCLHGIGVTSSVGRMWGSGGSSVKNMGLIVVCLCMG